MFHVVIGYMTCETPQYPSRTSRFHGKISNVLLVLRCSVMYGLILSFVVVIVLCMYALCGV